MDELSYNTQVIEDSQPCPNENCVDGVLYEAVYNNDTDEWEFEKSKCEYCLNH